MTTRPNVVAPSSLDEALAILADEPERVVLAGGTDLWPHWTASGRRPERVLSLHELARLQVVRIEGDELVLGAMVTHRQLGGSELVQRACPSLGQAALTIGAQQIQNRGTLGGNLVNASPADLPAPLLAADASLVLQSQRSGKRQIPLEAFYLGYKKVDLRPGELLVAVRVPCLPSGCSERFRKIGTRRAQAISKVVGATRISLDERGTIARARFGFGSIAPTSIRLHAVEELVCGQRAGSELAAAAAERAKREISPIDDLRSSAAYRRHIVGELLRSWILDTVALLT